MHSKALGGPLPYDQFSSRKIGVQIYDLLLAGLVTARVTSVCGVPHLPKHLRLASSTWVTNIDLFVHPCRWPEKLRATLRPQAAVPVWRPPFWWC